jgi:hypothetical protein
VPTKNRLTLLTLLTALTASAQTSVLTQHNDNARTGANLTETLLTPANVSPQTFGLLAKHPVDDQLYTQPLVATGIRVHGGLHTLVLVTTVNNSVYAYDANDPTDQPIWHVNFGTPADLHDANFGCLDINGNMGIIGTPVIDPAQKVVYVVALTRVAGTFLQRLHALDIVTGTDLPQSPVSIEAPSFDPLMQNQRPALALAGNKLYIGYASHCDKGPYHGFLFAYDATTLHQLAVLNTSPGGDGASIWQSGQAPAIDPQGNVFVVTGNGSWNGTTQFSESFLRLSPDLKLLDWFTPTNHVHLDEKDIDLDSSGATLIPGTDLVLGGGKEGVLYTLKASDLGKLGDEHAIQHFQATGSHLHSLVFWDSAAKGKLLYVWGQKDKARVYQLNGTQLSTTPVMMRPEPNQGHPGAMLSLSANGSRDGILWAAIHATGDSWHESRPGILHAYDAADITHELWNSLQNPTRDDCGNYSKMAPPTIANGQVYLPSFGTQNIGSGQLCVYGLLPTGPAPSAPTGLTAEATSTTITLTWNPIPNATSYTVQSTHNATTITAATGLTTPSLTLPVVDKGDTRFTVLAHTPTGTSPPSQPTLLTIGKAPTPRMAH